MLPVLRDHIQTEAKSRQMLMPCLSPERQAFTVKMLSHLLVYLWRSNHYYIWKATWIL